MLSTVAVATAAILRASSSCLGCLLWQDVTAVKGEKGKKHTAAAREKVVWPICSSTMTHFVVGLRLKLMKLPTVCTERIFRDVITFSNPEDRGYDDLRSIVQSKLSFMELPARDFIVFYTEDGSGDRIVVDDSFFDGLLRRWARRITKMKAKPTDTPLILGGVDFETVAADCSQRPLYSGGESDGDAEEPSILVNFEVEVQSLRQSAVESEEKPPRVASLLAECAPLTRDNLARHMQTTTPKNEPQPVERPWAATPTPTGPSPLPSGEVLVSVQNLTCPPTPANFFLRCILTAIRFKTPKPGITVAELDLCDAADTSQDITAVTFDDMVHKAIRDHLRGDRRQVLELRRVYVRRKTEVDSRYQTNAHPLLLRLDRSSKLEVVHVRTVPAPSGGGNAVITVREGVGSAEMVSVTQLMSLRRPNTSGTPREGYANGPASDAPLFASYLGQGFGNSCTPPLAATMSSSSSSGPRRTTFTLSSGGGNSGASTAVVSGAVPSVYGQQVRALQEQLLRQRTPVDEQPQEPGVINVSARDVLQREPLVEQHANREEQRKQRIRRRVEVSTSCLLCGLDCEDEENCMAAVRNQLLKSSRNRGLKIPTFAQLKRDLSDRRRVADGQIPKRLVCRQTFVNGVDRSVHVVHPRCAHLCAAYQGGAELEDFVLCDMAMNQCSLCGLPGASVACYHPQCTETYHVVCALYSSGYVNFGQRDPYLPCAACPKHTQVNISSSAVKHIPNVLHADHSCWEDGVAFDSRVVESTDLRDPDENDGW